VFEVVPVDELDDELDELELLDELDVDEELVVLDEVVVPPLEPVEDPPDGVSEGAVTWDCGGTTERMSVSIFRNTARTSRASLSSSCPATVMRR
jgi:hypothetical protein